MELDEIKTILKQQLEKEDSFTAGAANPFTTGITSSSVIGKIKRSIWFELGAFLLCIFIAAVLWMSYPSLLVHCFCGAAWLVSIIFCGYLSALYRSIIFYESFPATVKENLQRLIAIVTRFTRLYFRISMGLLPVVFVFGLTTGYLDISGKGILRSFHWSAGLLFYTVLFLAWSVCMYFFAKWYIRKLYGDYILQLHRQLKDIENG